MWPGCEVGPQRGPRLVPTRQVAEELESLPRKPARDESGLDGRRAGKHGDLDAALERSRDQTGARVVDAGKARIRDERHSLAGRQAGQEVGRSLRLIVLVITEELRADPVPVEQALRAPRVLAEHEIGLRELT